MNDPFLTRFDDISLSLDIVGPSALKSIFQKIGLYLERKFSITHMEMLEETLQLRETRETGRSRRVPCLISTQFRGFQEPWEAPVRREGDQYNGQMAYSYGENVPLWVVSERQTDLKGATDAVELWSEIEKESLPQYEYIGESRSKTSIIIPLHGPTGFPRGVLNFESPFYLPYTQATASNLKRLVERMGDLVLLEKAHKVQTHNTERALEALTEAAGRTSRANTDGPMVYLSYGHRCDKNVIALVKQSLKNRMPQLKIVDWTQVSEGGSITALMHRSFSDCSFAVCYFTDIGEDGQKVDNPNVVFEAGCFETLLQTGSNPLKDWIAIRDKDAGKIPFNLAGNKIIEIPDLDNQHWITQKLEERICTWNRHLHDG